jgi:hypothetical protein
MESAEEMAESIHLAIRRFSPESEEMHVVFQGGMFEHNGLYRRTVRENVGRRHNNEVSMALFRPVVGAGLMACADDFMLPSEPIQRKIKESIQRLPAQERDILVLPASVHEWGEE